jgi:hypothetical protein
MKTRIKLLVMAIMLSCSAVTTQAAIVTMSKEQAVARVTEIQQRAEEIKSMDLTTLSKVQRKEVRHELKDMRKELNAMGPTYIYISAGALILIIILLIILL